MEQQEKVYVIRHLSYWYTDEYYQPMIGVNYHAGHITDLFEDKDQAIQRWKQLEYEFSHQVKFENILYCPYQHDYEGQENVLAKKSIDELFEIIQHLENCVYALYEYPKTLKQQVFFDTTQNRYDTYLMNTEYDIKSNDCITANFIKNDPLLTQIQPIIDDVYEHKITLQGSLEELSESPILLKALIENDSDFEFTQYSLTLQFNAISKINPLLKQPITKELRYLTLKEIYQLEQPLNQTDPTPFSSEEEYHDY